jgi:hypothetical protein
MTWTAGITSNPSIVGVSKDLTISGDLTVLCAMVLDISGVVYVGGSINLENMTWSSNSLYLNGTSTGNTIETNGIAIQMLTLDGAGGEWTLSDSLSVTGTTNIKKGSLISGGHDINFGTALNGQYTDAAFTLDLTGTSLVKVQNAWKIQDNLPAITIVPGTSTILLESSQDSYLNFQGGGKNYYDVSINHLYTSSGGINMEHDNTLNNLSITVMGTQSISFYDELTFNHVTIEFAGNPVYSSSPYVRFQNYSTGITMNSLSLINNASRLTPSFSMRNNNSLGDVSITGNWSNISFDSNTTQTMSSLSLSGNCNLVYFQGPETGNQVTFSIPSGTVSINKVKIRGINATGGATYNATNAMDVGNNTGWNIGAITPVTYYWIGGTGDWDDPSNWSLTSGGVPTTNCLPTAIDNVIFDANSFTTAGQQVTTNEDVEINDFTWLNTVTNNPKFDASWDKLIVYGDFNIQAEMEYSHSVRSLHLYGSFVLNQNVAWNHNDDTYFNATTAGHNIDLQGISFNNHVIFDGPGGEWTCASDFTVDDDYETTFENGTFKSGGYDIDFGKSLLAEENNANNVVTLDFTGSDTVRVDLNWKISESIYNTLILDPTTLIYLETNEYGTMYFDGGGNQYVNLIFDHHNLSFGGIYLQHPDTFQNVTFNTNGSSDIYISDIEASFGDVLVNFNTTNNSHSHTFTSYASSNGVLTINASVSTTVNLGYQYGQAQTYSYDEITIPAASTLSFAKNNTFYFNILNAVGTCNTPIFIQSSDDGTQATLNAPATGTINCDYVYLKDLAAQGGASFTATNALDLGNNTGWTLPPFSPSTYYWVGGTGNWDDAAHWSLTSGGSSQSCQPNIVDKVVFDHNSFTSSGGIVTLTDHIEIAEMEWTIGVQGIPTFSGNKQVTIMADLTVDCEMIWNHNSTITIGGSFSLDSLVTWNNSSDLYFKSDSTNNTIDLSGHVLTRGVRFQKLSSGIPSWELLSDFKQDNSYWATFTHYDGHFKSNGHNLYFGREYNGNSGGTKSIDWTGTDTIRVGRKMYLTDSHYTTILIDPTSTLFMELDRVPTGGYTSDPSPVFNGGNANWGNIVMDVTYVQSGYSSDRPKLIMDEYNLLGNLSIVYNENNPNSERAEIKLKGSNHKNVEISWTGSNCYLYTYDASTFENITLTNNGTNIQWHSDLFTAAVVSLDAGVEWFLDYGTTNLSGLLFTNDCSQQVSIYGKTSSYWGTSTISIPGGTVTADNILLKDHIVQGGATFTATNATVEGTVTGWSVQAIPAYNLYWVGGSGDWDDANHWAFTSGGPGNGCVIPEEKDNVIFDGNSFSASGQTVTLNVYGYCNNMIWNGSTMNPTFNGSYSLTIKGDLVANNQMNWSLNSTLYLYGSITLHPDVNCNQNSSSTYFKATSVGHTIDMGGNSFKGKVVFDGDGGEWTFLSDFEIFDSYYHYYPYVDHLRGTIKTNGFNADFGEKYKADYSYNKGLDISNSNVTVEYGWKVKPGYHTVLNSANSTITFNNITDDYHTDDDNIEFEGGGYTYNDIVCIHQFTSNKMIKILDSGNSFQDVHIIPHGQKQISIDGSNTYNSILIEVDNDNINTTTIANIYGSNVFGSFVLLSQGTAGPEIYIHNDNNLGSFISAGQGTEVYLGANKTQTVTNFTLLGSGGYPAYFYSTTTGTQATIHKDGGQICCDFIWLKDIKATGTATFYAGASSNDLGNNTGWTFVASCTGYYWVGGSGNWSDVNHWATSSGGTVNYAVPPTIHDDVFFDANSFSGTGQTVTLDIAAPKCRTMDWTSAFHNPTLTGTVATEVEIHGSLLLTPNMTVDWTGDWLFKGIGIHYVDAASNTLEGISFEGPGSVAPLATWSLYNDLHVADKLQLLRGTLTTDNFNINTPHFMIGSTETKTLNLGSSDIYITDGSWDMDNTTLFTLNPGSSHIHLVSDGGNCSFLGGGLTYNNVTFETTSAMNGEILDANTFNILKLMPGVTASFDTEIQTATQFNFTGSCNDDITIQSVTPGSVATLNQASGTVEGSFLNISDNTATGGATFNANLSQNQGNVTGWNFTNIQSLALAITPTNPTCPIPNNGSALVTVSGGISPYLYKWSTLETDASITGLVAGTYTVEVTDSVGCIGTASTTLSPPASYGFTASGSNDEICFGTSDGELSVIVSGAATPETYMWSNGGSTSSISGLVAGDYMYTVTDASSCEATGTLSVTQRDELKLAIQKSANTLSSGTPIEFIVDHANHNDYALQFSGSYAYVNLPNSNVYDLGQLTIEAWIYSDNYSQHGYIFQKGSDNQYALRFYGSYLRFYTNYNAQNINWSSIGITNGNWHHIAATYNGSEKKIYVDGVLKNTYAYTSTLNTGYSGQTIGSGANGSYSFNGRIDEMRFWNVARTEQEIFDDMNARIDPATSGIFAYFTFENGPGSLVLSDITGNTANGTLTSNYSQPLPQWVTGVPNVVMQNPGFASATWDFGDGNFGYTDTINHVYSAIGLIPVSVTVVDTNGCTGTDTTYVNVLPTFTATLTKTNLSCYESDDGTVTANLSYGTPNYTYEFSNGETVSNVTTTSHTLQNLTPGTYYVTATDGNSDVSIASVVVEEPTEVTATCPANTIVCIDQPEYPLSDGSPTGGVYSGPGVSGGNFNPLNAGEGTHTINYLYTDANNCSGDCEFTIEVRALPVSGMLTKTPDQNTLCEGTDVSATLTPGSGGNGTDEMEYRTNDGSTWSAWSSYTEGNSISTIGKTNVEVRTRRLTDYCADATYNTVSWNTEEVPVSGFLAKTPDVNMVVEGTDVSATASAGSGGNGTDELEYRTKSANIWSVWTGYISGTIIPTTGLQSVEIQTRRTADFCNPSVYNTTTWIVQPLVDAGSNATICSNEGHFLSDATAANYTTLEWTTSGSLGYFSSNSDVNPTYYPNGESGIITLTMTADGSTSDFMTLTLYDAPTAGISSNSPICLGSDLEMNGSPANMVSYQWEGPESWTSNLISNTLLPTTSDYSGNPYSLTVTDGNGCTSIASLDAIVSDPQIAFPASPLYTMYPETISLNPGVFDTYLWQDNSVLPVFDVQDFGTYAITVTEYGCEASASIDILEVQEIQLRQGWGIFSSYINTSISFDALVSSLTSTNTVFFKNGSGLVYTNMLGQNINQIGTYTIGEGYQYKMWDPGLVLTVYGSAVDPTQIPITLGTGYQILGYLNKTPASAYQVMASVQANLYIMKDEDGKIFMNIPLFGGWFNQIGDMHPGKGYKIKMNTTSTLTYPANPGAFSKSYIDLPEPQHFTMPVSTGNNMTLGIPNNALSTDISYGDEVGVFNSEGILVGAGVYQDTHMALTIWGKDEIKTTKSGIRTDEALNLELWRSATGTSETIVVENWIEGNGCYQINEIAIIGKLASISDYSLQLNNYPNPFAQRTTIEFEIPTSGNVEIKLYNSMGELTKVITDKNYNAGVHTLHLDSKQLSSGNYFIKMETNGQSVNKAIQVVK